MACIGEILVTTARELNLPIAPDTRILVAKVRKVSAKPLFEGCCCHALIAKVTNELHGLAADLVKAYLARIEEASEFKAVLQVNPEAVAAARELDEERVRSASRGPLHGIPMLIKDNIATQDKLDVSAAEGGGFRHQQATRGRRLDSGQTNLSEWTNFRGLNVSSGWNPRGGQTLGIYYHKSTPEGSSAGSAIAASLALSTAALGSETFGSILQPAEFSNVVGLKPTRGLVGNDGAIPISSQQDVIGTLTRTVKDAAHLLSTMAGRSDVDERIWNISFDTIPDFTTFYKETDLSGITIGVPRNSFDADSTSPFMASFEGALETLRSAGADVVDNANFSAAEDFRKLNQQVKGIVRSSEFRRDIVRYLDTLESNPNKIHSAGDIIEFTKTFPGEEYPDRDIGKFLWTQTEGIDVDSQKYKDMVERERSFGGEGGILRAMAKYKLDVLVVPSSLGIANDLAAKMGFPVLGVPLGFYPEDTPVEHDSRIPNLVKLAPGMPYSLTLITKAYSDGVLLQVAYAFEQLTAVRDNGPPPIKLPTTELKDVRGKKDIKVAL
ncbi:hypothetical protein QQX98_008679 [Neonectria punicea]|uniref:Amidase domain-containing protein n=1 Tax=Neonectria punicea TaxID=979145 RepID=A0ABR1GUE5_9HYPO